MAYYKSGQIYATQNSNVAIQTASGSIASFETPLQMPVFGLKADIVPAQSGSGTPSPSNSRTISGRTQVLVTKTGKNIANFINGYGINNEGKIVSAVRRFATVDPILICPNTHYYIKKNGEQDCSFILAVFNNDVLIRRVISIAANSLLDTSGGNKFYVAGYVLGDDTVTIEDCLPMVVIDNNISNFEAYKGETKTISLGQTVYGGTLDLLTGKCISDVVIASYDGSEDWKTNGSNGVWLDAKSYNYLEATCCNIFEALPNGGSNTLNNNQLRLNASGTNLLIKCPDAMTADDFKTFLQTHPLQVAYRVASTETNLTPETFKTFVGTNNFYADCGDIEVKYKNIITGG